MKHFLRKSAKCMNKAFARQQMKSWTIPLPFSENLVLFTVYRNKQRNKKNKQKKKFPALFPGPLKDLKNHCHHLSGASTYKMYSISTCKCFSCFFVLFLFLRAQMGKYSWSWLSAPYTDDVERSQTRSQRGQETQNTTPNITSLTGRPNQTQVCDKVGLLFQHGMRWITHCIQLRHAIYCFCFTSSVRLCFFKISSLGNRWRHPGNLFSEWGKSHCV